MQTLGLRNGNLPNASTIIDCRTWSTSPRPLPLFIEPLAGRLASWEDVCQWLTAQRDRLTELVLHHGGIVLRNFPIETSEQFSILVELIGPYDGDYSGGASARAKITGRVMESTRLSREIKIPLHQEMAYLRDAPGRIMFFCKQAATQGGETIVADMRDFTARIPASLRQRLETLGMMIVRNFAAAPVSSQTEHVKDHPDQRSWKYAFYTEDQNEVDAICSAKGMRPIWNNDGSLTVVTYLPTFTDHPATGERLYRSVVHIDPGSGFSEALPSERRQAIEAILASQTLKTGYYLGDGSTLANDDRDILRSILDELEMRWQWQDGDIMLLDNLLAAHGRNPFTGGRDVQVGLLR